MKIDLKKVYQFLTLNIWRILLLLSVTVLSLKGTVGLYKDAKMYFAVKALEERGLKLETEQRAIITEIAKLDSAITSQAKQIEQKDFQVKKKNVKQKLKDAKGLIITDADIDAINSDSLLSKWTKTE